MLGDLLEGSEIFGSAGLFNPGGLDAFDLFGDRYRLMRSEAAMHLDVKLAVVAHGFMHGEDELDGFVEFLAFKLQVSVAERIKFQVAVACIADLFRGLREILRLAADFVPAVGVGGHAFAGRPTEKFVDRQICEFANAIPARHLHHR